MNRDMTTGNPAKILIRFSLPLLGSVMFQQLYNIADSVIAGKCSAAGEDAVGMGADYGAIEDELPAGMTGVRDTHKLIEELDRRGNSTGFIEKFAGLNMLRVIKAVIK